MPPAISLIRNRQPESVFAYRGGQALKVSRFMRDVEHLAHAMPKMHHILNLCTDRYHFAVCFAAALLRGQVSLLPPNYTPHFVERLQRSHPDLYCLADGEVDLHGIEIMRYPNMPEMDDVARAIPDIPAQQIAALVFTSGSTGQPVAHAKSWGSLCKGATSEAAGFALAQNTGMAILGTVPAQHMYGLESCMLLAMQNGYAMVAERPFYPSDICAQLNALPQPRCLVTTPVHLRTLLAEAALLPPVEFVLCATAYLAPQLAQEAEARFGAPLFEIYGCTEAGMVASRHSTRGELWYPLPGVKLQQDAQGTRVSGGHVEIDAYLSDVVKIDTEGTFTLHGREADLVNIAGKRTSLSSLNHHLNEVPGVQDGVFFMPDDNDGTVKRPLAFVVAPGLHAVKVLEVLRKSVDAVFLPRPLYFVDALPRNATGKLSRESLIQLMERCAKK
jgi:acyl-coenzyme A synthetase/AMP-(fatty) acid ligase